MFQKLVSVVKIVPCLLFLASCCADIDKTRYITIDQISPGMDAVCLTVYKGVEPEKFNFWKQKARDLGFEWVMASPFTRSSKR